MTGEKRMRKLDPRSVMIGFLLAVIGFMSIGATGHTPSGGEKYNPAEDDRFIFKNDLENKRFNRLTVFEIVVPMGGLNFIDQAGDTIAILGSGLQKPRALTLFNESNTPMIHIGARGWDYDKGVISLSNTHGEEIVYMGETDEQDGILALKDRYGDFQWGVTGKRK
jgi:hypothetical protein